LYRESREAQDRALKAAQLESQLAHARLEALRAQLNPHFLFNALNVVAMLVRRGANDDALRAVVNLSELLRRVLAAGTELEVSLRDEMALVERYLDVEQLRFRDRLTVHLSITADATEASVPGLILQPIVENAIKHGVANAADAGRVEISARHEGRRLLLRVCDNGPGFAEGWDPLQATGLGLANTRERLDRTYDGDYRFDLGRGPDGGAAVEIEIPYRVAAAAPRV
jgi:LytS/YehU family sensor histidine kinase